MTSLVENTSMNISGTLGLQPTISFARRDWEAFVAKSSSTRSLFSNFNKKAWIRSITLGGRTDFDGSSLVTLTGHSSPVLAVNFDIDGRRIVSGSSDKTLRIWEVKTGKQLCKLVGHVGDVKTVMFSFNGYP